MQQAQKEKLHEYEQHLKLHYTSLIETAIKDEIVGNNEIFAKYEENYLYGKQQERFTLLYNSYDTLEKAADEIHKNALEKQGSIRMKQITKGANQ